MDIKTIDNFDELNVIVGKKKSEPFHEYFKDMAISKVRKQQREALAVDLYDAILPIMALMFTYVQHDVEIDWAYVRLVLRNNITEPIRAIEEIDEYLDDHIDQYVDNFEESTRNNADDPYFYSDDRAMFLAEDESNGIYGYKEFKEAKAAGKTVKIWKKTTPYPITRDAHEVADGQERPIDGVFELLERNGTTAYLRFPKDTYFHPSAYQIANCKCVMDYR